MRQRFIELLPDRKGGKRGPRPIAKEVLAEGLFLRLRYNVCWEDIPHGYTVWRYFQELQRSGFFSRTILELIGDKKRPAKLVIDSTNVNTYHGVSMSKYNGKYHNDCIKFTLAMTEDDKVVDFIISKGSMHDSKILDTFLSKKSFILPYELFLDKGYENYSRRRVLKKQNCQVRMQQKNYAKNKKRGPRFLFSSSHSKTRTSVEKNFAYLKAFASFKFCKYKSLKSLKSHILAILLIFTLSHS